MWRSHCWPACAFYTVFGALSDRVGRKKDDDDRNAARNALFYIPIYKGMQHAAGNNVASVSSVKDKVTGAIKLTPLAPDATTGKMAAAKEPVNANRS